MDVLEKLKENGYSTYRIRNDKNISIGSATVADLKNGKVPGIKTIDILCGLLECQPGDLIGYENEKNTSI